MALEVFLPPLIFYELIMSNVLGLLLFFKRERERKIALFFKYL